MSLPAAAATNGILRGNVVVNNAPKAGVIVTVKGEGSLLHASTDASGNFSFNQVPFGHYVVDAHSEGFPDASQPVDVQSDTVAIVNLQIASIKEIGHTQVTARGGVSGTPVSNNVLSRQTIAALPGNNSLNSVVQTVPGVVKFSYNESVAHGFHGLTYEIDGAPLPQATSSNFSEIIDPKNIDSLEVFTGAFPAEYGGSRQGAVVNILSNRSSDAAGNTGSLSFGGGNYGQAIASLNQTATFGKTSVFFNANAQRNNRGLDAPTFTPIHDDSSQADQFLRLIGPVGSRGTLAADFSNQFAQFQIPINTDPNNPNDPVVSVPGTNDVQKEYDRYANLNFTLTSKGGNGVAQVIPWYRYTRIAYDGDLANDVLATQPDPVTGAPTPLVGVRQDRSATYAGIRLSNLVASTHHAIKLGIDASRENFQSNTVFAQSGTPNVLDGVTQPGTLIGLYAQDKWTPSKELSIAYGVRYDHSTGFTNQNQISPRIGINLAPDSKNVVHAYYGRLFAAPSLEDTRRDCILIAGCSGLPVYDLRPERDSYYELGVAHAFSAGMNGYINSWWRSADNVLDTTQLANTPLFAVFNNTIGRANGVELRLQDTLPTGDSWFASASASMSYAGGISGSTFLFCPDSNPDCLTTIANPYPLQPEDHDQTYEANGAYTHRFGTNKAWFATAQVEYGTGYPVQFQSGPARLPAHSTVDLAFGKDPGKGKDRSLGFNLDVQNLFDHQYIFKIANGFNTTQIASGRNVLLRLTAPF